MGCHLVVCKLSWARWICVQVAVQSIRVLQAWYGGFAGKQGTQAEDSSSSRTSTVIALSRCFMNLSKTILMIMLTKIRSHGLRPSRSQATCGDAKPRPLRDHQPLRLSG
jgi:hypothetical protein